MEKTLDKPKRLNKTKISKTIFLITILAWPMIHFIVFYVAVNFNSILLAFKEYDSNFKLSFVGFDNFVAVIKDFTSSGGMLLKSVLNSGLVFVFTTVLGFPLNILFSYYLFKKTRGHNAVRFIVMIPSIISSMVMALVFVKIADGPLPDLMKALGMDKVYILSDKIIPTVIFYTLWTGFSTSLILYPNAMNAISSEVIESAKIDGTNNLNEIWHIILPLIFPTITTFFVVGVAGMLAFQGPLFVFYEYNAPVEAWTSGYFLFRSVMGPGSSLMTYPRAAAAGLLLTAISAPLTMIVKWAFEKFGPGEE